jgi:hypothetical protein
MIPACLDVPTFAETLVDQSEPATPVTEFRSRRTRRSALHASAFSDGGRRAVGAGLDWTWDLEFCAATFARKRDSYTRRAASLGFGVWSFGVLAFGIWNFPSSSAGAPYSQRSTAVTSPGLAARNAV